MKKIKWENSWSNVIFLIGSYFIIIILVVSLLGGYLYHFLYKTVYLDFEQRNEQHLSAVVRRHENDMQIVENIVFQMGQTDSIRKFKLKEDLNKVKELKSQLKGYTNTSEFFELLFYYYHEDDYLYHMESSINLDYFLEAGCFLEDFPAEKFKEMIQEKTLELRMLPEQTVNGNWIKNYIEGKGKCTILLATVSYEMEETLLFFVPDTYYDELLEDNVFGRCTDFLYYDDRLIVSRGGDGLSEQDLDEVVLKKGREQNLDVDVLWQEKAVIGEETYLLSIQKGESGLTYGTLQSMEVFYDKIKMEHWTILFLIMICMVPAVFILLMVSKGFIRKVKACNQLLNEDSYYNLGCIEKGIQSLVMIRSESEKENLILKKTRFIRNFARGDFATRKEALVRAKEAGLQIDYEQYVIVLLRNREMTHENKAYSFMLEIMASDAEVEGYGIHMINNNQKLFVLFGDTQDAIDAVLEKMLEIVKSYCEEYVIAVSNSHGDFSEAPQAFLEADTAFDNYLLRDNSKIIYFSEIVQKNYVNLVPDTYLHRLKYAIRTSDMDAIEVVVKDICSQINRENVSLYAFRVFYNNLIHMLMLEWQEMGIQMENYYNVFTLSQCMNIQDFHDILCEICRVIIGMKDGKVMKNSNVAERAVDYMSEHFSDSELTMNALADYIGVSSVTLSIEFKNEMDVTPSDYLATLRMEKAKELLRNTNMLVREISLAVGYLDDRVFLRRFKKYTGMTPGQYRNA